MNFPTALTVEEHIRKEHQITKVRCPGCLKLFKTHAGLTAHCESLNSRCKVHLSRQYPLFLDRISGGFLIPNTSRRADFSRKEDGGNVGYIQYESSTPHDFKGAMDPKKRITIGTQWESGAGVMPDGAPQGGYE